MAIDTLREVSQDLDDIIDALRDLMEDLPEGRTRDCVECAILKVEDASIDLEEEARNLEKWPDDDATGFPE